MYYVCSVLILAFGVLLTVFPDIWFYMVESWKSNASEPSQLYRWSTRIFGIFIALCGIALFVLAILSR